MALLQTGTIDVVNESTGNPAIGLVYAREAPKMDCILSWPMLK
jgi:hypothetical protein